MMPEVARAQTLSQIFGYLNILVGLIFVASVLTFAGGFVVYISRLHLPYRDWGIDIMSWGVTILFVLVVMLAFISFVQNHLSVVLGFLAFVALLYIGWFIVASIRTGAKKDEKK